MGKLFLLFVIGMASTILSSAQSPVAFVCSLTKIDDFTYAIRVVATTAKPWHIYSMRTPEGGPVPTTIQFAKNPLVKLTGQLKEEGMVVKKREDVFEMDVLYFDGPATWIQNVTLTQKIKTRLSGTVHYMICNDQQCLPPTDHKFEIAID